MLAATMIARLLLVDDDDALAGILAVALGDEGFTVDRARDGVEGLRRFERDGADLLILDVLMPGMDGLELCRRVRRVSAVPIILLTSRGEEVDRVTGLETGADDYVTKPFSTRELVARIRALDRRLHALGARPAAAPAALDADRIERGPLVLDPPRFSVRFRDRPVPLTRAEFQILAVLARHAGIVMSRDRLLDAARGDDAAVTDRTVDTVVKRLRKKLRDADPAFDEIETVFGVGYRYRE
jgi:DNA-binding response OmpR family regulator